jgi:3D (Asp-Asp-Asp) domain-containing protein
MLAGIDELERATLRNRTLADRARAHARLLRAEVARLADARMELAAAERRTGAALAATTAAARIHRATVARIRSRTGMTHARLAELEARARAAQRTSVRLSRRTPRPEPDAGSAADATVGSAAGGATRSLVVDAVAYHLPGRTASDLPVGVGVIAVDPAVIPLGTRVFVPGYGAAVAADVGAAIEGPIIDLWLPSTAAARAWGRRTVTITVYG